MKKFLLACVVSLMNVISFSAMAAEPIYQLSMTSPYPDSHYVVRQVWLPWAEEIKQKTNGRVNIIFYNANTLCPVSEHYQAVLQGKTDIAHSRINIATGQFPVASVLDVPSNMSTPMSASEACWRMYQETPEIQEEFKDIKILTLHAAAPYHLNFSKDDIFNLESLKGKRILVSSGTYASAMQALGAIPAVTPRYDFKQALARQMADGCLLDSAALHAFQVNEQIKNITVSNINMGGFWLGMNKKTWDSFPPDIQKIFEESCGLEMSVAIGQALYAGENRDQAQLADEGVTLNILSIKEQKKWLDLCLPKVRDDWAKLVRQSGLQNPQTIYDRYLKIQQECEAEHSGNRS